MSYAYTNGPFFHTGLKLDYTISDKWSFMVGVFNRTDYKVDTTNKKYVGGQLAYVNGAFKLYLNALTGAEPAAFSTSTLGLTASYQASPKFGLGIDLLSKTLSPEKGTATSFFSSVIYANYAVSDAFLLALRGEYFNDSKGVAAIGDKVTAVTLSGNFKLDGFTFIPEIRIDNAADGKLFNGKQSDTSFLLAGIYKF